MNAVDTNVLIYSVDRSEPIKQLKAQRLLKQLNTSSSILLWQVIGETIQQLRRWKDQGKLTDQEFHAYLSGFRKLYPLVLPTSATIDHALDLGHRYCLSHWDSMILGACQDAGVMTLYTEDMGSPRRIDNIDLINPFL